ncbi:MAG TPA: zinc-dependent metalloprotease family protein [Actinomycetes bacterium]|nr:zinc-dependent metalloprotease family protein [Actinomycetes bacterium]
MRKLSLLGAAVLAAALLAPTAAQSATPASGSVGGKNKSTTWTGTSTVSNPVACTGAADPTCDHFLLDVSVKRSQDVSIAITAAEGDDWDLFVYGPDGSQVASSTTSSGNESVVIDGEPAGTYEVRVQPWMVSPGATYDGRAALVKSSGAMPIDVEQECLEPVPAAASPSHLFGGDQLDLAVSVLVDGPSVARAQEVFGTAASAYAPLGVTLSALSYETVSFTGDDAQGLIDQAKARFGGTRPAGSDLVYVFTDKDIQAGGNYAVAGLADCIGGVRFDNQAFAVGEDFGPSEQDDPLQRNGTAKVLAHELGHLMGAHHHYANCVEGNLSEVGEPEVSPCTLMFNAVNLASLNFSTANSAVVRGHTEEFAAP